MKKSIISRCGITFISIFCLISLVIAGCSSDTKKDEESEAAQEATDAETSADAQIEASSGDTSSEAALDQEAASGDANVSTTSELDIAGGTDGAAPAPAPETQAATETPAEPAAITESSEASSGSNNDLFGTGSSAAVAKSSDTPRKAGPLQHIKDAPFERGGILLNTVYIARQGDTLKSVSEKLFGENKSKDLKKANPSLKNNLKVGEKVYFNSPARADDHEKLLVVYEDQGLPATVYVSKEGDSLKSLSNEWFGSEDNWKELYSVNRGIASTKELPAGTEIRYWPATVSLMAYTAKQGAPGEVAANDMAKDPLDDFGQAPPPPAAGSMDQPPPPPEPPANTALNNPPPPPEQMAPPPPVEAKPVIKKSAKGMEDGDRDLLFAGAIGAACLILGGLIYHRRRSRKMNITQV